MRRVERIKDALDTPAFTTDVIVGFPGESDADFEATLEFYLRRLQGWNTSIEKILVDPFQMHRTITMLLQAVADRAIPADAAKFDPSDRDALLCAQQSTASAL